MSDLLPLNATPQERAISLAVGRDVPTPIRGVWNPDTCPADLLPWLAWSFNLDTWDTNWTDEQKRGAIKSAVSVHKRKGTIGALRAALDALGYDIDVIEWFEKTPAGDPYTFRIDLTVDQVGIPSSAAYDKLVEVANATKNLRSHLEGVDIRGLTRATEYIAAACLMGETVNISAEPNA